MLLIFLVMTTPSRPFTRARRVLCSFRSKRVLPAECRSLSTHLRSPPISHKPVLITTPIYYVNSRPHVGHLYTSLLADATSRYYRLSGANAKADGRNQGRNVIFSTGTDEHGQKIQEAAEKAGVDPRKFCDEIAESFAGLHRAYDISNDDFVRTTQPRHVAVVRWLWRRLVARGAIYLGTHEGWYCRSDEAFLADAQVCTRAEYLRRRASAAHASVDGGGACTNAPVDGASGFQASDEPTSFTTDTALDAELERQLAALTPEQAAETVSSESGHSVEWLSEPNYRFRLSDYSSHLLRWLDGSGSDSAVSNSDAPSSCNGGSGRVISPEYRGDLTRSFIASGLTDLSVSRLREKVYWAIPVPGDPRHSVYVWLDALANYLTVAMDPTYLVESAPEEGSGEGSGGEAGGLPLGHAGLELPDDVDWRRLFPAWPADVHVVGKDILKFHAAYWPAFLLAAGLPPPARIVAHGHWTVGRVKMSKSLGNVVDPMQLVPGLAGEPVQQQPSSAGPAVPQPCFDLCALRSLSLSVDAVRYFLLREGRVGLDGDFSPEQLVRCAVGECADGLGNLASRVMNGKLLVGGRFAAPHARLPSAFLAKAREAATAAGLSLDGLASDSPIQLQFTPEEAALAHRLQGLGALASESYGAVTPSVVLEAITECVADANRAWTAAEPWKLAKAAAAAASGVAPAPVSASRDFQALGGQSTGTDLAPSTDPDAGSSSGVRLTSVMYLMLETLRVCGVLLQPVMPTKAPALLRRMGWGGEGSALARGGASWHAAVFGSVPPCAYPALDVSSAPLVMFPKPAPHSAKPPATDTGGSKPAAKLKGGKPKKASASAAGAAATVGHG